MQKNWHFVQLITWTIEEDGMDNNIIAFGTDWQKGSAALLLNELTEKTQRYLLRRK